jgi:hypothetical protein
MRTAKTANARGREVMTIVKEHRFPTSVRWLGGRLTRVSAPEEADLALEVPVHVVAQVSTSARKVA